MNKKKIKKVFYKKDIISKKISHFSWRITSIFCNLTTGTFLLSTDKLTMTFFLQVHGSWNSHFHDIKAIDRDLPNKPNSQISLSIEEGSCSSYFEFPLTTRSDLAVRQLIEYDKLQHCELTIRAHDHGYPQLSSRTTVQIRIVDIDNKDPVFTRNMYAGYIKRNSQPGSLVNMTRDGKF